jgi:hypothetical protein
MLDMDCERAFCHVVPAMRLLNLRLLHAKDLSAENYRPGLGGDCQD